MFFFLLETLPRSQTIRNNVLFLYWWIHEEIMEWTCVCVAALVKVFTNLWRWFRLWRHSEKKINTRFNESVTNRAEHVVFGIIRLIILRLRWYVRHQMRFILSLIVCVGHFGCIQMRVSWPTDDWTVKSRTWRRNLRPGPFKKSPKGSFLSLNAGK